MPLDPLNVPLDLPRAAHLLRRVTFGATPAQIDTFAALTPEAAFNQLFVQLADPAPPIDPQRGQTWVNTTPSDAEDENVLQECFKGWFIGQMMSTDVGPSLSLAYSAREKMVLFLHTHFTCIQSKVNDSRAMYFQNALFRKYAFDQLTGTTAADPNINIKSLTVKISVDNAMLRLLDGNLNVKGNPNENYARELLELYSIGRGLEGAPLGTPTGEGDYILYTEEDVRAAARVLSGWEETEWTLAGGTFENIDTETTLPRGRVKGGINNASAHDNTAKQFSARFQNTVIQGNPTLMNGGNATEASALDEIRQLIDLIYSQRATAKNICWKLYRFFVYAPHTPAHAITIDGAVIDTLADILIANNFKLQPVIKELLCSKHFYDANTGVSDDSFGGIIKSPIDLILGTFRMFEVKLPSLTDTTNFYMATDTMIKMFDDLGMRFYEPYDVAGYDAYHQYPIYHRSWITPNYLARRYDFIREIFMIPSTAFYAVNGFTFVNTYFAGVAGNSKTLIKALAEYLLPVSNNLSFDPPVSPLVPQPTLTAIRMNFFRERFFQVGDEAYWASRWPTANDLPDQLAYLFNAMLQSPEYQLA